MAQLHLFKGARQRGLAPPGGSEFALQCAVADVLRRWGKPTWLWTHIGHGERRDPVTGARLKRAGVMPGWPDLILLPPKNSPNPQAHFLELKRRAGYLSEAQAGFQLWARLHGYPFEVVYDLKQAIEILRGWGAVRDGVQVQ